MVGPAHNVDAGALRGEPEHSQRVGILTADQPAHRSEFGLERAKGIAEAAHMYQPLTHSGHNLLMLAKEIAVRTNPDLGVEHGAEGLG